MALLPKSDEVASAAGPDNEDARSVRQPAPEQLVLDRRQSRAGVLSRRIEVVPHLPDAVAEGPEARRPNHEIAEVPGGAGKERGRARHRRRDQRHRVTVTAVVSPLCLGPVRLGMMIVPATYWDVVQR